MKQIESGINCYELTLEDGRLKWISAKRVVMGVSLFLIIIAFAFIITYILLYPPMLWLPGIILVAALVIGNVGQSLTVGFKYVLSSENLTVYKKSGAIFTKKLLISLNSIKNVKNTDISAFNDNSIIKMCLITSNIIMNNGVNEANLSNFVILVTADGDKILIKSDDYMLSLLRGIII